MKRLLLVEPNRRLAQIYRSYLAKYNYEVVVAYEAQGAIFAADESAPDVVIAEIQLPGHNGIEFLYEFRSYSEWQDIPVVLLTLVPAHSLQITPESIARLGVADILYKPVTSLQTLGLALESVMSQLHQTVVAPAASLAPVLEG